ncbi:hypothetical protein TVAG_248070 [Trichomonas vaginalis G3]|uniref:Right handed beta helix domain-containing protein n=1 Tax=Trichomonas vaginalis (strain ATCC PRA-98 / G3) TaxID=412133 RepID=A2FRG2_TRIV3|nr:secreted protein-related family [Trichomonas vaginalis G3]EAX84838.1 hypothetical protein TVAG_287420 [Trichomonas vaginalis G3]EAX92526.1 hypothetical protein TVAG_248070 [Trichomonas vaginalis G3]KAI5540793.1 secreted protein-related family [Trichomonas vaginalis G3]|eukprot:XP_001297768.1 hypothetical protein [Trichomonas vaginalis G3]
MLFAVLASAVDIQLKPGINYVSSPIEIKENHTRIIGEKNTRLIGGIKLSNWAKVTDNNILNRLDESVRSKIYQIDLKEFNITNLRPFYQFGYTYSPRCSHNHLYIDQQQMNIAQYPRVGEFINVSSPVTATSIVKGIGINDSRIYTWKYHPNIMAFGYWNYRWSGSAQKVTRIDKSNQKVYLGNAGNSILAKQGDGIFFYNILEEIRYPGDFYIDNETKILYFLPFGKINSKTEIFLSNLTQAVIRSVNTHDIEIRDISIEATCYNGIEFYYCTNVTIDNVKVFNIGLNGLMLYGSNITLNNSLIHNTLNYGLIMSGGNRATLEKSNNLIYNCEFYYFGNLSRSSYPAILLVGVGHTVRNCLIYNGPQSGIIITGNDHLFEKNEMHHLLQEASDNGVIYLGNDYTFRGNILRNNYIHDVFTPKPIIIGFYFDSCVRTALVTNNILYKVKSGLLVNGGRDYIVKNNVFIGSEFALLTRAMCAMPGLADVHKSLMKNYYNITGNPKVAGYLPPYSERYENITKIDEFYKRGTVKTPLIPPSAIFSHNIFCNNTNRYLNATIMDEIYYDNNIDANESDFADFENGDYSIKKGSRLNKLGIEPIDMSEIGLIKKSSGKGKTVAIVLVCVFLAAAVVIAIIIGFIIVKRKKDDNSAVNKTFLV